MRKLEHTIYAVATSSTDTDIKKVILSTELTNLELDDVQNLIEAFCETSQLWLEVLEGQALAVLFDGETGNRIRINVRAADFYLSVSEDSNLLEEIE